MTLGAQGYSHVQISPAQKSNPTSQWWGRYQPIDYAVVDGRGSAADLKRLTQKAHGCGFIEETMPIRRAPVFASCDDWTGSRSIAGNPEASAEPSHARAR